MIFFPPAKINIGLNILDKYEDGFHRIESVLYKTPLTDVLEIVHSSEKNSFNYSGIIAQGETNLVERAAVLFFHKSQITNRFFKIHLHKNIPIGAGLGGGSADAAYCLMGLNKMCNEPLSQPQLERLAADLGSDCVFFLKQGPQYLNGRGHELSLVNLDLSNYYLLIVKPEVSISTASAYQKTKLNKKEASLIKFDFNQIYLWNENISNDFEAITFSEYPKLKMIKDTLYSKGALYASMSGSGSAFYGIFNKAVKLNHFFSDHFYFFKKFA